MTIKKLSLVVCLAMTACAKQNTTASQHISAEALKPAAAVYAKFIDSIHQTPVDNDFVRYASDSKNYDLTIVESSDYYYYSFYLRPYNSRPVLDGRVVFRVQRSNWNIESVAALPANAK
jgi:hypothetical protein